MKINAKARSAMLAMVSKNSVIFLLSALVALLYTVSTEDLVNLVISQKKILF